MSKEVNLDKINSTKEDRLTRDNVEKKLLADLNKPNKFISPVRLYISNLPTKVDKTKLSNYLINNKIALKRSITDVIFFIIFYKCSFQRLILFSIKLARVVDLDTYATKLRGDWDFRPAPANFFSLPPRPKLKIF